jgi:hypothetical protein
MLALVYVVRVSFFLPSTVVVSLLRSFLRPTSLGQSLRCLYMLLNFERAPSSIVFDLGYHDVAWLEGSSSALPLFPSNYILAVLHGRSRSMVNFFITEAKALVSLVALDPHPRNLRSSVSSDTSPTYLNT